MSRLDSVFARLRALPPHDQEAVASQIEEYLESPRLTPEQWAEVLVELAGDPAEDIPHEVVVRNLEQKYGA